MTAAELIAMAAFFDGKHSQAFPFFGVERTGAPIEAYARIDDKLIRLREQINEPDVIIIQDPTLLTAANITKGADKKTLIIINTSKNAPLIKGIRGIISLKNIYTVDATKIALEKIGRNIVNTTILGAFAKATGLVSLNGLKEAIKEKFKDKGEEIIKKNINAVEETFKISNS